MKKRRILLTISLTEVSVHNDSGLSRALRFSLLLTKALGRDAVHIADPGDSDWRFIPTCIDREDGPYVRLYMEDSK